MFFPDISIRTRITFEKGIYLLGGQTILFLPSALDKKDIENSVEIFELYIDTFFQGEGIGSILIKDCIEHAKNQSIRTISLWVLEKN